MKRLKFETLFRGWIIFCVVLLLWSVWASAQDAPATNVTAVVKQTDATTGLLTLPIGLEKEAFLTFGLDRIDVLKPNLGPAPRWQYIASLIYVILALYISKFLDWFIGERLKKWAEKTETRFDDLLIELLHGPIKVVSFVIFLHIGLEVFAWPTWVQKYLSKGLAVFVAVSLTYVALKAADMLIEIWRTRVATTDDQTFDDQLFPILRRTLKIVIVVIAVLLTCSSLDIDIRSLIALGSVGGLAVGLAAQDTLANLFGAIAVFVDKPFKIGDRVKIGDVDGTVQDIGLRSTRVRNLDGYFVTLPNQLMTKGSITNITRRPNTKTEMNIGLTYDTSPEKVRRAVAILTEVYKSDPKTFDLIISFNKFADSALNILVLHWYDSLDAKEYLAAMQELNLKIKERFDAEKINFAFPTRTLYVKQDSNSQVGNTSVESRKS